MGTPVEERNRRWRGRHLMALAVAAVAVVCAVGEASADQIAPDGDIVGAGDQSTVDLGTVAPGTVLKPKTSFTLVCNSSSHVDNGQSITLEFLLDNSTVPSGGSLSATDASIGPIPSVWPDDGTNCPSTPPTPISDNGDSTVTITAPTTTGPYSVVVAWGKSVAAPDVAGTMTKVTYTLTVAAPSDTSPPVISYVLAPSSPDGSNGWYKNDVTLTWTVAENESPGSLVKTGCVDQNITADQAATTYSCSATSDGGTAEPVSVTIKRDATAPTVVYTSASGTAGNGTWYTSAVTATFTDTDNLSGFDSTGNLTTTDTNTSSGEGSGVSVDSPAFTDWADNTVAAGATSQSFDIDLTNPTVTCDSPPTFLLNQSGTQVSATVADGQSGPFASPVTAAADTSAVGSFTADVTGYDVAGRHTTVSCDYKVVYDFHGFVRPVDDLPTLNVVKAGSAVPVKFDLGGNIDLGGNQGLNIFRTDYPNSTKISCSASTNLGDVEKTVTAGGSGLNYNGTVNPPIGRYIYVWKTDKAWAGTCRRLDVKLNDGTEHLANFMFTR